MPIDGMTTEWTCGVHTDSTPPFHEVVAHGRCLGGRKGACSRPTVMVFAAIDEGDGTHAMPPLCMVGACAKHRDRINQVMRSISSSWLGYGQVPMDEVPELIAWFHGRSGLCRGDRALALLSPQQAVPASQR